MAGYWDWSWDNLKNTTSGILSDPNQMMENPWFNAGMGILSENQKPYGGDPYGAFITGVKGAKETKQEREDRERIQELRKQIAEWLQRQQTGYPAGVQAPGGGMMTPVPQQPPRSILDQWKFMGTS